MRRGETGADALRDTVALAKATEALGYARYWVAEHHSAGTFAGTSPEILVGQILANTTRIRVGSGGVMLAHYSALKVAEQFRVLESFYPGRVDLGIGRAPGSDQRTLIALAYLGTKAISVEPAPGTPKKEPYVPFANLAEESPPDPSSRSGARWVDNAPAGLADSSPAFAAARGLAAEGEGHLDHTGA